MRCLPDSGHATDPFERRQKEQVPEDWQKGVLVKNPKKVTLRIVRSGVASPYCAPWARYSVYNFEPYKARPGRDTDKEQAGFRKIGSYTAKDHCSGDSGNTIVPIPFHCGKKAFHSVQRPSMWIALINYGVPRKIVRIIQATYDCYSG